MAIKAVLLDLEGVLYQKGQPIKGALEAVRWMRENGFVLRFVSNTTTMSRRAVLEGMNKMGFPAERAELVTPAVAAVRTLREDGCKRVHLAAEPALVEDFAEFERVEDDPDAVVLGDLGPGFTYERLNALFAMLLDGGARLYALHKNRYWRKADDLILDLGPFVAALEYATGLEARVMGKPSPNFFEMALLGVAATPSQVLMVGDDIDGDILGAEGAGIKAVQVRTGKFRKKDEEHPQARPAARVDSIADLPALLERLKPVS